MPQPSIRNYRSSPPSGGWSLIYHPPERPDITIDAQGHSHEEVLEKIRDWRVNNNLPAALNETFQWANAQWCQRDPGRCTSTEAAARGDPPAAIAGSGRKTLTPADYGRSLWLHLNTFPISFNYDNWLAAIDHVKRLLNPLNPNNHGAGCPACHIHFFEFCSKYPPHLVTTDRQSAVWTWLAHDAANVAAAKPHRPSYNICATIFGWDQLTPSEFAEIQLTLLRPK